MTIGDLARVNLIYGDSGRSLTYENVFGFKAISVGASLTGLSTAFKTALVKNTSGGILSRMNSTISSDQLTVRDVLPGTAAEVTNTYTAVLGGVASESLPPQCAGVITWRTGLSGRSHRGRTFLPGVAESDQSDGILLSGYITAVQAVVTQMLAVFGPAGSDTNWQFVVISEVSAGVPRVPKIGTAITAGVVQPDVQSQRRRNN